jgi:hypothetical protein
MLRKFSVHIFSAYFFNPFHQLLLNLIRFKLGRYNFIVYLIWTSWDCPHLPSGGEGKTIILNLSKQCNNFALF